MCGSTRRRRERRISILRASTIPVSPSAALYGTIFLGVERDVRVGDRRAGGAVIDIIPVEPRFVSRS